MVTRANDIKDSKLLETLKDCFYNKEAYYKKITCNKSIDILVMKYQYTDYQITVVKDGKHILDIYDSLFPFDCYNMIEELKAAYAN